MDRADDMVDATAELERPVPPRPGNHRVRQAFLLAILATVAAFAVVHYVQIWYYERQLMRIAADLIEETNREDPIPVSELGPEADVDIDVTCSFGYLVFGKATGKITLLVKPRPHAPTQQVQEIAYVYALEPGGWKSVESYGDIVPDPK